MTAHRDIQQNYTDEVHDGGKNIQYPQKTTNLGNDHECFGSQAAVDPILGTIGDYGGPTLTIPLQTDSPAIDAATSCPITDQRGYPRNNPCDIGAYEFGGGIIITSLSPSWSGLNDIQDITLAVQGAGFGVNSIVRWVGSDRPTNYIRSFLVKAELTANDLDTVGVYTVTVYDSDRSLESEPMPFYVVPFVGKDYLPFLKR